MQVHASDKSGCPFCADFTGKVELSNAHFFAIPDVSPVNKGHHTWSRGDTVATCSD